MIEVLLPCWGGRTVLKVSASSGGPMSKSVRYNDGTLRNASYLACDGCRWSAGRPPKFTVERRQDLKNGGWRGGVGWGGKKKKKKQQESAWRGREEWGGKTWRGGRLLGSGRLANGNASEGGGPAKGIRRPRERYDYRGAEATTCARRNLGVPSPIAMVTANHDIAPFDNQTFVSLLASRGLIRRGWLW